MSCIANSSVLPSETGKRASLVGWSLGGVHARNLAKRAPDQVRQVITLGSPFGGSAAARRHPEHRHL